MNSNSGKIWMVPLVLTGFYFWSIMPRMTKKPDMSLFRTKLYAHRGLHDNRTQAPENSMAAFRKAVEAGYGIELDVQLSADKVPVIFHDFSLQRACKVNGQVRDYTFRELRQLRLFDSDERIPSLKEFLAMVDGRVPLIVEYKSEDPDMTVCEKTDPLLRAYKGSYCIESFNPLVLYWYRKKRPGVVRGQLSDGFIYKPEYRIPNKAPGSFVFQFLLANFLSKPDFIAYNLLYEGNLSRRLCRNLYKAKAAAWTVKDREQLRKAARDFDIFIFDSFIPGPDAGQEFPEGTCAAKDRV